MLCMQALMLIMHVIQCEHTKYVSGISLFILHECSAAFALGYLPLALIWCWYSRLLIIRFVYTLLALFLLWNTDFLLNTHEFPVRYLCEFLFWSRLFGCIQVHGRVWLQWVRYCFRTCMCVARTIAAILWFIVCADMYAPHCTCWVFGCDLCSSTRICDAWASCQRSMRLF